MPPKKNPLNLNALQLKTLSLVQALARLEEYASPDPSEPGAIRINRLPQPHGNHFHLGNAVVASADATGLGNPAVWTALERKGLTTGNGFGGVVITALGLCYDTGLSDRMFHRADH
ncbi:MAG: hypothetical protein WCF85_04050 [Rhodospirillaceae bacterium]